MRRIKTTVLAISVISAIVCGSICYMSLNIRKNNDLQIDPPPAKPGMYNEYFRGISIPIGETESGYAPNYRIREFEKSKTGRSHLKSGSTPDWVQRGPGNVAGRTRALVVDPDDPSHNTWYAGSASGGIWKTVDGGETWEDLTVDFPTLATVALVMAPSNHDIIYAGTGEGFGIYPGVVGTGIFKTNDKGDSWDYLPSTASASFNYVNKLAVDPGDEDIVLACTDEGIYKTLDGGINWDTVYQNGLRVQDIAPNPDNFDTLYAAVNSLGIIKSTDAGDSWDFAYTGIGQGARFSVDVSPVDTRKIYALAEAPNNRTEVYVSSNSAKSWNKLRDADVSFLHFLGSQGFYNNIIRAHPFNADEAFVGGVTMGKVRFDDSTSQSNPSVMRVDTVGTGTFMGFINFGGTFLGGGMSTGDLEDGINIEEDDWSSIEIRFGPGKTQKAYRFTVPAGRGSGVEPHLYSYEDYIDVPFEVWDTDRNRQLMASFRDQERDGEFNLVERIPTNDILGREYIFVQALPYDSEVVDTNIAKDGGHVYKQLYFYWPTLVEDGIWDAENLPDSKIDVTYGIFNLQDAYTTIISSGAHDKNTNLHVDHHELIIIPTDPASGKFSILNANDGGLGLSLNNGGSWKQITDGYITTQFYGVAKRPGSHQYIGGMQDNGTWQSPAGQSAVGTTPYTFRVGGDGFATVWNANNSSKILASSQNNSFSLSKDGGETWKDASEGLGADGPFFSRLAYNPNEPERVFTVGGDGVYRGTRFGEGRLRDDPWELRTTGPTWAYEFLGNTHYDVKVSRADPDIVWAGTAMFRDPDLDIFVSTDGGESFSATNIYDGEEMGVISGIATHPSNPNEAFLLFSYAREPKILRTTDLGQTWTDISGFEDSDVSTNGFPDVMVFCVLVHSTDNNIIWAGTEIGLYESIDNGETWNYVSNGLPAVAIWDMFEQDGQVVLATHGRGIWTADVNTLDVPMIEDPQVLDLLAYPNPARDAITIQLDNGYTGDVMVEIVDIKGTLQQQQRYAKQSTFWEETLDLTNIPAGQYIIRASCNSRTYRANILKTD